MRLVDAFSCPTVLFVAIVSADIPLPVRRPNQLAPRILLCVGKRQAAYRGIGWGDVVCTPNVSQHPIIKLQLWGMISKIVVTIENF